MKLVWCPELASKAYINGVRALVDHNGLDGLAEVAELISAMVGGWNAHLIVKVLGVVSEESSSSSSLASTCRLVTTSLALAAAAGRMGGHYTYMLPAAGMLQPSPPTMVVVRDADEAMARLEGVDLLMVDAQRRDAAVVLQAARPGPSGMVVVRHDDGRQHGAMTLATSMGSETRTLCSIYRPIGKGVEVVHVSVRKGPSRQFRSSVGQAVGRWIRHVNHNTSEEHIFWQQ